jgi:hypothetical protein
MQMISQIYIYVINLYNYFVKKGILRCVTDGQFSNFCISVVEQRPNMSKALGLIPNTNK